MPALPTSPLVPNPVPQNISGPLVYIVAKGQIIGRATSFTDTHNIQLATSPELGSVLYAEQDGMLYSGTLTLTKFAVFGALMEDLGLVGFGNNILQTGYLTFSIFDRMHLTYLRTYYDCMAQSLEGSWQSNQYVTETATFQFLNAQ
jgi:hypothetical protein